MSSSRTSTNRAAAKDVRVTTTELILDLVDGRRITVPLSWYPRLMHGKQDERNVWELMAGGTGIHWPLLDEDISIEGILEGRPSGESKASLTSWMNQRSPTDSRG
jgi:hypothetical protein